MKNNYWFTSKNTLSTAVLLLIVLFACFFSGRTFLQSRQPDELRPSPSLTETRKLSHYLPKLAGTGGDTDIYIFRGAKEGGTILALGGTHPNEPGGRMAAILMVENLNVDQGTVIVIPRANNSAATHQEPGDAYPLFVSFTNKNNETRMFRYGSRYANPIDSWPDMETYEHAASGQILSGAEIRNMDRCWPGREDGMLIEQVCYALRQLIIQEGVDLTFDFHEASPEYPNDNSAVVHQNSLSVATRGIISMQLEGIQIKLEMSPENLHGLSHREIGDYTESMAILMETPNAAQGRLRGATNEYLAKTGKDGFHVILADYGLLYVPWDENGHPIEERAGRHLSGVYAFTQAMNKVYPEKTVSFSGLPHYKELLDSSVGDWLN